MGSKRLRPWPLRRLAAGHHVTYGAGHRPRRTQAPPRDVTQPSDRLYLPRLSAFANWLDRETAPPLFNTPPESWGTRLGAGPEPEGRGEMAPRG